MQHSKAFMLKIFLPASFAISIYALYLFIYISIPLAGDISRYASFWDGKFYYAISNDLSITQEKSSLVDMPAYRYQRVGPGIIAKTFSILSLNDSVTPVNYLFAMAIPILTALIAFLLFCKKSNHSIILVSFLFLSGAPFFSIIYGFTDGVADATLILAFICAYRKKIAPYVICMSISVLCRESYVIFPVAICLSILLHELYLNGRDSIANTAKVTAIKSAPHLFIFTIFSLWQTYIYLKLGQLPSNYTPGTQFGLPFESGARYALLSLSGETISPYPMENHVLTRNLIKYSLLVGIFIFTALVLVSLKQLIHTLYCQRRKTSPEIQGFIVAAILTTLMYACFGDVMMWENVGYVKAATILIFFLCITSIISNRKPGAISIILAFAMCSFTLYTMWMQIGEGHYRPAFKFGKVDYVKVKPACIKSPSADIQLIGVEDIEHTLISRLSGTRYSILNIYVKNTSQEPLSPYLGPGTTNASYHWLSNDGREVKKDGIRTPLPHSLQNGESTTVKVLLAYPEIAGEYILKLTLVQEGCSWLYNLNPEVSQDILYRIR